MNRVNKIILYLFLVTAFQIFSYEYFKEIKAVEKSGYKEFYITEDIYSNSKNNLEDIRIIDKNGKEVPYVIETPKAQEQFKEKIVAKEKIIEKITKKDKIEFIIKFGSDSSLKDIIGNRLEIIPVKNFYSEYELFGSSDGTNWEHITSGEIYKTPEKENLTIKFQDKRYEYYKIVTPVDKGNIFSEGILKFSDNKSGMADTIKRDLIFRVEQKEKSTILKVSSKFLPLKSIELDVEDEFKRNYSVGDKESYYNNGTVFKVGEKSNLSLEVSNVPQTDQIIVEIKNGDNRPLKIKNVKGNYIPDRIVFKANSGESYRITFGDKELHKPEYDLVEFSDMIKDREIVTAGQINKIEKVSQAKPKKDYTIYYNIFIGIIVLILIGFTAKKISRK